MGVTYKKRGGKAPKRGKRKPKGSRHVKCLHCLTEWDTRYDVDPGVCTNCKRKDWNVPPKPVLCERCGAKVSAGAATGAE